MNIADRLIGALPVGIEGLFNPWADCCIDDLDTNGPLAKRNRLAAFLDCDPEFILCGEAPGHLGCRHTGIPFTSESQLVDGVIPRIPVETIGLTKNKNPLKESSATIVWKALYDLDLAHRVITWNAINLHPHALNNHRSNRTPTPGEIALGKPALEILIQHFPGSKIIAVGRKAEELLKNMNIAIAGSVRHPANGGANEFRKGLKTLLKGEIE